MATSISGGNGDNANITDDLCSFIVSATYSQLTASHVDKLKDLITDCIGIAAGAASISESGEPFLRAVIALGGQNAGRSTVFSKGKNFSIQYAGLLNAAFAHSFDFDDTHASSILHPGATIIPAALAQAEVTCRIGRAYNYGGYTRGFHNTSTAGIFGAVATIAKLRNLTFEQVRNALGIAGSKAAGSMQFLENGAWNKRLHPGFAVHDAFVSVVMAEAGVVGASRVIEGRYGALHSFSATADRAGLGEGLGREWISLETAIKPFPACRMTHSAIEVVAKQAMMVGGTTNEKVFEKVTVALSPGCYPIVGPPDSNRVHPKTIVDGQFSMYYQVAIAWLYGMDIGWGMYDKARMESEEVRGLCDKVEVVIAEDVPDLAVRVTFRWTDGSVTEVGQVFPLGEVQYPFEKKRRTAMAILDVIERIHEQTTADLMRLL
ncbi:hypothetical protein GGR50DRAFT_688890 [Xylaria sp. CBS 124048]|nr:hypothetical protein GGR50DRAFT_688890 [Xylaria sp. CBS 124048]